MDWPNININDLNIDMLLDIDISRIRNTISNAVKLTIEDLENIDWEMVASWVLGVTDPVGQIISFLTSLLNSFVNTIISTFQATVTPIQSAINTVLSNIQSIAASLTSLTNIISSVVVTPIRDALNWVSTIFPRLVDLANNVAATISSLPGIVQDTLNRFVSILSDLVSKIQSGLAAVIDQISRIPDLMRGVLDRITAGIGDLVGKIQSGFSLVIDQVSKIPDLVRGILDRISSALGDLAAKVQSAFSLVIDQVSKIPDLVRGLIDRVTSFFGDLASKIQSGFSWFIDQVTRLPDLIQDVLNRVTSFIGDLTSKIQSGFSWFIDQISRLPDFIRNIIDRVTTFIGDLASKIQSSFSWFIDQISRLPDLVRGFIDRVTSFLGDLAGRIQAGFSWFIDQVARLPDFIRNIIDRVTTFIGDLTSKIQSGFSWFIDQISRLPDFIRNIIDRVTTFFGDLAAKVQSAFSLLIDQISRVPDLVRSIIDRIISGVGDLASKIQSGFSWFIDQVTRLPDLVRSIIDRVTSFFGDLIDKIRAGFSWFIDQVTKIPEVVRNVLSTLVGDATSCVGGIVGTVTDWIRKGFETITKGFETITTTIKNWFTSAGDWFDAATKRLYELGAAFQGFVNAVLRVNDTIRSFGAFFDWLKDTIDNARKDPKKFFGDLLAKVGEAIWNAVKGFIDLVLSGLGWLAEKVVDGVTFVGSKILEIGRTIFKTIVDVASSVSDWFWGLISGWFKASSPLAFTPFAAGAGEVEGIFQNALKRTAGVAQNLWLVGAELIPQYWKMTLLPFVLRGLVDMVGDATIVIEPSAVGTKVAGLRYRLRLRDLADAFVRGFETFASSYALGVSIAVSTMLVTNISQIYTPRVIAYYDARLKDLLGDILKEEFDAGASINMFLKPVSETNLIDYARRMLALSEGLKDRKTLLKHLSTVRAHLKIYGLPQWYVDFLTSDPEKLAIKFEDRFGVTRTIFLSHIFELPTHSELARMTQRDIFPGVDVMKKVGWVRGWNEDLTTMIYLLTFKYPSFEKLWIFYMRALSGMLWFKAPDTIASVFAQEAQQVGAGIPISPYDLQRAMRSPDQVKAFETALNTYFKWIEYSNFSWFTEKTEMYGIPIGREIISKLGGWTADSWLMIDVAADIPTKIDMRWMSRFGIFLLMAKKFEEAGVRFETYAPLVDVVPRLLDANPATPIQVDLRWFSKLIQATGLHPAWVPVVTVAENIMVIADEMTLLRTGWLNLFKEGLITVSSAEQYLSGLLVASYLVGYWDPVSKEWKSGWINLPVRWLPHERRLLQLRMAIDRVLDVFREIYSYIRSGIRTLALTPDTAEAKLKKLVDRLNEHYRALTKEITGIEMTIGLDAEYIRMWVEMQALAQDIEAIERARAWWFRTAGWLLYRISQGYVSDADLESFIAKISEAIPLHEKEVAAYKAVAKAVMGIVRRESIPSPSTLATFAEYMIIDPKVIDDVLSRYNVPEAYAPLWRTYIMVKPLKTDFKAVLTAAARALRYNVITQDDWSKLLEQAKNFGFTDTEISLLNQRVLYDLLVEESRAYLPTPSTLATLSEYVSLPLDLVKRVLEARRVPKEWMEIWLRYITVRPVKSDFKAVLTAAARALRYSVITQDEWSKLLAQAKDYGFSDVEIELLNKRVLYDLLVEESRVYLPTPSTLATLSEYVSLPLDLVARTLEARRVPKEWIEIWMRYITVRPIKSDFRAVLTAAARALRYNVISQDEWGKLLEQAKSYGFSDVEIELMNRRVFYELLVEESRVYLPTPSTLATLSEYVSLPLDLVRRALEARRVPSEWIEIWMRYITVRPLKSDYRALLMDAVRAVRFGVITRDVLDALVRDAVKYGFTDAEVELLRRRIELAIATEEAREYVPTPAMLATLAEYVPEVRDYIKQVFEARRIRGVWAELWARYILIRPFIDEVRRFAERMFALYTRVIIDEKQLEQVFKLLSDYGYEGFEIDLIKRSLAAELFRNAYADAVGSPRQLVTISRYTDKAADMAWSRVSKMIDLLPIDNDTKNVLKAMWKEYIMSYQAYPEIRSYITELINAYAAGVLDDTQLEQEFNNLRKLGVPELRLQLAKRTAMLRRARRLAR